MVLASIFDILHIWKNLYSWSQLMGGLARYRIVLKKIDVPLFSQTFKAC